MCGGGSLVCSAGGRLRSPEDPDDVRRQKHSRRAGSRRRPRPLKAQGPAQAETTYSATCWVSSAAVASIPGDRRRSRTAGGDPRAGAGGPHAPRDDEDAAGGQAGAADAEDHGEDADQDATATSRTIVPTRASRRRAAEAWKTCCATCSAADDRTPAALEGAAAGAAACRTCCATCSAAAQGWTA